MIERKKGFSEYNIEGEERVYTDSGEKLRNSEIPIQIVRSHCFEENCFGALFSSSPILLFILVKIWRTLKVPDWSLGG